VTTPDLQSVPTAAEEYAGPAIDRETVFAAVLADVLGVERVSVDSHFFDELGADSLVMARFCARVRKRPDLPPVSMKDIYRHPTIRGLATGVADATPCPVESPAPAPIGSPAPAGSRRYFLCGTLQFLSFLAYSYLAAVVAVAGFEWISAGSGLVELYLRSFAFGAAVYLGLCIVPILAKWMLIGRWKRQQIPLWSLAYLRFWLVKTLIHFSPMRLFTGSPLYPLYLRALGADVGRGVVILSRNIPICTDLLTIGDGTVVRKDSFFTCYRAQAGVIETGPVSIGKNVVVSEATVIDIDTSLGDGAQLGHRSSLHAGQAVPDGERWHGSPAQPAEADYRAVEPADCGSLRRGAYAVVQLLILLLVEVPLTVGGVAVLLGEFPQLTALETRILTFTTWTFYAEALVVSFVLFFGFVLVRLLLALTVPRLLKHTIQPDKVYRLYGFQYGAHRAITRLSNLKIFPNLFGDSSYIVPYLRWLGYDFPQMVQTGSNFGLELKHETPFLTSVGSGTMIADGLSVMNADFSNSSFRVSRVSIGARNFLGNKVLYPARGRTGENCLLATKVMIPVDGEIRENVGLLGSPCFEIPRSVVRDNRFDHLATGDEFRRRLVAKNRYNLRTMAVVLLLRWMRVFAVTLIALGGVGAYERFGAPAVAVSSILILFFTAVYSVFIEWAALKFRRMSPQFCSVYDPHFWWHERYWKVIIDSNMRNVFNGTPFKILFWRLAGVRIGRRVFDDGCDIPERTLVTIGDDCMLNAESVIQAHSQEDGTFKSDRITIGAGCTLGIGALVHYGVVMGDGTTLAADSFLMKGSEVPPGARWGGNPAREETP
jgi:non-ribosomal peptide synthetase-like protein